MPVKRAPLADLTNTGYLPGHLDILPCMQFVCRSCDSAEPTSSWARPRASRAAPAHTARQTWDGAAAHELSEEIMKE